MSLALVAAVAAAGCEKGGGSAPKGSGALEASDKAMFQYLPAGQLALAGGNYFKFQSIMQSGFGQAMSAMTDKMVPGMSKLIDCFANMKGMKVAMGVNMVDSDMQMRMVWSGITLAQVSDCSQKAGFKTTIDPDNKYASVELSMPAMNMTTQTGYLQLPNGTLYSRQAFAMSMIPKPINVTRADLEGDISGLSSGKTAADDAPLMALVAKVDRSKVMWFAGNASALTNKIGEIWGSFDIASGMSMEATVQVKNKADADKVADGIDQLRKMSDQVPGDFKDVIKNLKFTRDGEYLHFGVTISEAAMKSMASQFSGMFAPGATGGASAPPSGGM